GSARRRELSILSALGASRWQIIRHLLCESAIVASIAALAGVLLAHFAVRGLIALSPVGIPRADEIRLDVPALFFTVLISLAAATLTGLAPALSTSRGDLARQLNEASRGSTEGRSGNALRMALVVFEVALSFVLVVGAGLLLKSFSRVQKVETGFDTHGVLAV